MTLLSLKQVREAKARLARGCSVPFVAHQLGVSREAIRRATDPAWTERKNRQNAASRLERLKGSPKLGRPSGNTHRVVSFHRMTEEEYRQAVKALPDDTQQSLTARLCGDPLPGRSALDQRAAQ